MTFEKELHKKFRHLKYNNEWYKARYELLTYIDELKNSPRCIVSAPSSQYINLDKSTIIRRKNRKIKKINELSQQIITSDTPNENIKNLRIKLKLSYVDIAREIGVPPIFIKNYEEGIRKTPNCRRILKAIKAIENRKHINFLYLTNNSDYVKV